MYIEIRWDIVISSDYSKYLIIQQSLKNLFTHILLTNTAYDCMPINVINNVIELGPKYWNVNSWALMLWDDLFKSDSFSGFVDIVKK